MQNNVNKLLECKNKSVRVFALTISSLRHSQGFYSRWYYNLLEMGDEELEDLINTISEQNFNNELDVVLWLEG